MRDDRQVAETKGSASTLGLAGDGDELDMLEAVESSFGIRLDTQETERIETVGQLFDVVLAKTSVDQDARKCATAIAFYRLRRALGDRSASPRSRLDEIISDTPARLHRRIERDTGLAMPRASLGRIGLTALFAAILLVPATIMTVAHGWPYWPLMTLPAAAAVGSIWLDSRRWHEETLGEMARKVANLNFAKLSKFGARSSAGDAWMAYTGLLSDITGIDIEEIGRETRFI
nr:acyl carrier protein [Mesorhizobium sp.]